MLILCMLMLSNWVVGVVCSLYCVLVLLTCVIYATRRLECEDFDNVLYLIDASGIGS